MFMAYEEMLRVPLVWSNPQWFPTPKTTEAIVSHVDLLPTLCAVAGVPNWQSKGFQGIDYSHVLLHPDDNQSATAVQPYVLFTWDDIYAGNDKAETGASGLVDPPNRIQMVRTPGFKMARYWDGTPNSSRPAADQGEFYDLRPGGGDYYANDGANGAPVYNAAGPLEARNLSDVGFTPPQRTQAQLAAYADLKKILKQETGPGGRLADTPLHAAAAPEGLGLKVVRWTEGAVVKSAVQVAFLSRENTRYQVQKSVDLAVWANVGDPIPGNNGWVLRSDDLVDDKAFYRIQWSAAGSPA